MRVCLQTSSHFKLFLSIESLLLMIFLIHDFLSFLRYLTKIHRIGIGSISLPDHIKPGEWAYMDDDDLADLGYVYESKTDFTPRQERSLEKDPTSDPAKLYNKFWSKHRVRGDEYQQILRCFTWEIYV